MGFERLARRGQVAEALKARTKCVSLISSTNGRYQRVFSRAGSESELHFKSLLWNLREKRFEEDKYCRHPGMLQWCLGYGEGIWRRGWIEASLGGELIMPQWSEDCGFRKTGQSGPPSEGKGQSGATHQDGGIGEKQVGGWSGQEFCLDHYELGLLRLSSVDVK